MLSRENLSNLQARYLFTKKSERERPFSTSRHYRSCDQSGVSCVLSCYVACTSSRKAGKQKTEDRETQRRKNPIQTGNPEDAKDSRIQQKTKKPRYQEDMETRKPGNHAGGNEETRKPGNHAGGNEETRKPGNQGTNKASSEAAEDARKPRKAANGETSSQTKRIKRKRGKRRANQRMRAF